MKRFEWIVRTTSYLQGTNIPFTQVEISLDTRVSARQIMKAQKALARHALLRTEVEMFYVKNVTLGTDNITRFYTKRR